MEKFKNIVGKIQVEKENDGDGYWIHDEECFICGSLGLNEEKVKDLIKRAEGYDKAIELLKEFAFYSTDSSIKEHCERSSRVQEFLRDTYAKEWLYSILKEVGDKELEWKSDMIEWGEIYCPFLGREVMTYYPNGTPAYDSVTNPFMDEDGGVYYYKYDHDEGGWIDGSFSICDADEYENVDEVLWY